MIGFVKETNKIYRLKVPFMSVYTSVFLIDTPEGYILVDAATTKEDVDFYIMPSLRGLGVSAESVKGIVITHSHGDHAGGLARILEHMPNIEVIREPKRLSDGVFAYPLPGHTKDFVGVLDARASTLISGDGLQGAGIKKFRTSLETKEGYLRTLEAIKADARIENILFSHAYEPWYEDRMIGREAVLSCHEECKKYIV